MKWIRVLFSIVVVGAVLPRPAAAQVFTDTTIEEGVGLFGASITTAAPPGDQLLIPTFGGLPPNGPADRRLQFLDVSAVSLNNTNTITLAEDFFPALAGELGELNVQAVEPGTASYLQTVSNIHASAVHLNFDPFTLGATEYFEIAWLRDVDGLPSFAPGDGVPAFLPGREEFTAISFSGGEHRANIGRVVDDAITNYTNSEPIFFASGSDGAWFVNWSPREVAAIAITLVTGSDLGTAQSLVAENPATTQFFANDPASVALLPTVTDIESLEVFGAAVAAVPATDAPSNETDTEADPVPVTDPRSTPIATDAPPTTDQAAPATTEAVAPATTGTAAPATTLAPAGSSTGSSTDGGSSSNTGLLIGGGIGAAVALGVGATAATKKRKGAAGATSGDGGAATAGPEPLSRGYEAPFDPRDAPYEIAARRQMVERGRELGSTPDGEGFIRVPQSVVLEYTVGFADDPDLTAPRSPEEATRMEADARERRHRTHAASGKRMKFFSEPGRRFRIHQDSFEMDTWMDRSIDRHPTAGEQADGPAPEKGSAMLESTTDEITNL